MEYRVRFATEAMLSEIECEWPAGSPWVMCEDEDTRETILWIHHSARQLPDEQMAAILEEAWEGFRAVVGDSIPRQRLYA